MVVLSLLTKQALVHRLFSGLSLGVRSRTRKPRFSGKSPWRSLGWVWVVRSLPEQALYSTPTTRRWKKTIDPEEYKIMSEDEKCVRHRLFVWKTFLRLRERV